MVDRNDLLHELKELRSTLYDDLNYYVDILDTTPASLVEVTHGSTVDQLRECIASLNRSIADLNDTIAELEEE